MREQLQKLLAELETSLRKSKSQQFNYSPDDAAYLEGQETVLCQVIDKLKEVLA